ncbi:hypothetical protein LTA6_000376 [Microbacterium sp. LTA6]|uniref:hypothetical protein n=1 Tax=Microbacterium sp. LTA6 TaxID=3129771 RepID=UPI00324C7D26
MTEHEDAELASSIEAAVRATPGVKNLYRSGSLVSNLVDTAIEALGLRAAEVPLVSVTGGEDGITVEMSVGVDASMNAVDTVRAVHQVVDAELEAAGAQRAGVRITVVHVHESTFPIDGAL